jgi:hypothetical protein
MSILKAYTYLGMGQLSTTEQALYFRLFLVNNLSGWGEWFGADNRRLMFECNISSKQTLERAKQRLKDLGFIDYIPGKKGKPTMYTLTTIFKKGTFIVPNTGENTGEETGAQTGEKTGHIYRHIDKDNKTKKKSTTYSKKKFTPPTLEEVREYVQEKNLHVDADYFFQYYSEGDWKDKAGNPVKSWKQKLITWNRRDGGGSQQQKPASTIVDTDIDWSKYDG